MWISGAWAMNLPGRNRRVRIHVNGPSDGKSHVPMKIRQARVARLADHGAGIGLGADQQRLSGIPLMARTCGGKQFVPGPFDF